MLRIQPLLSAALFLTLTGCGTDSDSNTLDIDPTPDAESDAEWEELGDDDSSGKDDDGKGDDGKGDDGKGDDGKGDDDKDTGWDGDAGDCGEEVQAGAECEGGWEETLCQDESGTWWWCENGVWTSK